MSYTPYTPYTPKAHIPEHDPFEGSYGKWMTLAMTGMKPVTTKPEFILLQFLFDTSPSLFVITSPLHSNDDTDCLHFSVLVKSPFRSATLHINGFWKTDFRITSVTMMTSDNISGRVDCGAIVTFNQTQKN